MNVSQERLLELFLAHPQISTDSRKTLPNSIFFALNGTNYNANRFAAQALQNGSSFAVIDDPDYALDERYMVVDDSLQALQALALSYRQTLKIPVIGITGTNGKTSTKNLIHSVLKQHFKVHATLGNLNNHIGVPLTILSCPSHTEILIVEMGANHPGEIAELCTIALPTYGIVTNVGIAHIEGFISFEHIVETKTALYRSVAQQQGLIWVPDNQQRLIACSDNQDRIVYGFSPMCDYQAQEILGEAYAAIQIDNTPIHSKLIGRYNTYNLCAAAALGSHFGLSVEQIRQGLEAFTPENMRSQMLQTTHYNLFLDAYNANPSSMQAAIESLSSLNKQGPPFVILGDMLEMGPDADQAHQTILEILVNQGLSHGILIGQHFNSLKTLATPFHTYADVAHAQSDFSRWAPTKGSVVLIKGSRGIGLEALIPLFES